jgi:hypothetical protein
MTRLAKLQLAGPLALAFTIAAEELATYWLVRNPSSEFAWYLNLNFFGAFQRSHNILSYLYNVPYFQLLFVAAPILFLACGGLGLGHRLAVAVASNLSFAYAFFLAYATAKIESPAQQAASLTGAAHDSVFNLSVLNPTIGPWNFVLIALVIPTMLSFVASHLQYIRAVRET